MKVKVIQQWPITYHMIAFATGCEFEADEQTAAELIAEKRAEEVKSLKTDAKTAPEQPSSPKTSEQEIAEAETKAAERKAALIKAIVELQAENPAEVPSCNKIKAKSGQNVTVAERDALLAEMKGK